MFARFDGWFGIIIASDFHRLLFRNVALLSFGDEADDLEDINGGIKSSHDLVENDPRLSKEVAAFDFTDKEVSIFKKHQINMEPIN